VLLSAVMACLVAGCESYDVVLAEVPGQYQLKYTNGSGVYRATETLDLRQDGTYTQTFIAGKIKKTHNDTWSVTHTETEQHTKYVMEIDLNNYRQYFDSTYYRVASVPTISGMLMPVARKRGVVCLPFNDDLDYCFVKVKSAAKP